MEETNNLASIASPQDLKDRSDLFSLKVKPEYVLRQRASCLPPLESFGAADPVDARSNEKKTKKGRNPKRPRDTRIDHASKFCLAILRGEVCQYGDKCRFPHDLNAFMASRPADIKEIGDCPIFAARGKCPYGVLCRVGTNHVDSITGQNIVEQKECVRVEVVNGISKELQNQLRKKSYPFKCKRHFEKSTKNKDVVKPSESNGGVAAEETVADYSVRVDVKGDNDETAPVVELKKDISDIFPSAPSLQSKDDIAKTEEKTSQSSVDDPKPYGVLLSTANDLQPLPSRCRKIIDFSNKVYIAPLTTVGNLPFRRVMKRFGADITCGEMALAQGILEGKASEWALLKRHDDEDVFGVQIAAGFPDMFTRTVELIENHTKVDFVDLNLGCPLDLVCDKGAGASLMLRDKKLKECLDGITKTLSCPVTIKIRTGWDEKKPMAHQLVPKIQSWNYPGIGALFMHGRSRLQRYSKEADWDYIHQVCKSQDASLAPCIPFIGNGDILNFTDYEEKVLKREGVTPCAMLARGALIKPWLPTEIKERRHWDISATERLDILKLYVRYGLENWGSDQQGVNNCRRFLLEWLSFLHRYVPIGLLEQSQPQQMNQRPPNFMCGRNDLETLFLSNQSSDWVKISEMLLGPVPDDFRFEPKHKANSYVPVSILV